MTLSEFDRWSADLSRRFPSVPSWVARKFPTEHDRREFQRTWFEVLATVPVADALEVNRQMQAGDLSWVGDFDDDKEKVPQHVRRLARRMELDRREPEHEPDLNRIRRDSDFPAGKILRRLIDLKERGTPHDEARRIALEEFPVGKPKWQPRFHCPICLDAGFVTVASNAAIEAVLAGEFDKCHHREGAMRCKCKGHLAANPRYPICVYDQEQDYIVTDFLWRDDETQRFIEWAHSRREAFWNSKRHSEFDQFNQREFA